MAQRKDRSVAPAQRQRRNRSRPFHRSRRPPSPTAQILVDAALDAAGLLCLAGFARAVGWPLPLPAEALVLLVAGVDLVLHTSLRRLALGLLKVAGGWIKGAAPGVPRRGRREDRGKGTGEIVLRATNPEEVGQ